MNRDHMRIWVDALRNDEAGQCVGELVDMRGCHCVVGVGIVAAGLKPDQFRAQFGQIYEFRTWLGETDDSLDALCVNFNGVRHSVFELNDKWQMSFSEIADLLEAQHLATAP